MYSSNFTALLCKILEEAASTATLLFWAAKRCKCKAPLLTSNKHKTTPWNAIDTHLQIPQHTLLYKDMPTHRKNNRNTCEINTIKIRRIPVGTHPLHKETPRQSQRDCLYPISLPPSISSALGRQSAGKPIQAFVQTVASGCACGLDEPLAVTKVVKAKLLSHFCRGHCLWQVLSSVIKCWHGKLSRQMIMSLWQSTERHGHLSILKHMESHGWSEKTFASAPPILIWPRCQHSESATRAYCKCYQVFGNI